MSAMRSVVWDESLLDDKPRRPVIRHRVLLGFPSGAPEAPAHQPELQECASANGHAPTVIDAAATGQPEPPPLPSHAPAEERTTADEDAPHTDLDAYVLGEDRTTPGEHLADCDTCRADLGAHPHVVDLMPYVLKPELPPAGPQDWLLTPALGEVASPPSSAVPAGVTDTPPPPSAPDGAAPAGSEDVSLPALDPEPMPPLPAADEVTVEAPPADTTAEPASEPPAAPPPARSPRTKSRPARVAPSEMVAAALTPIPTRQRRAPRTRTLALGGQRIKLTTVVWGVALLFVLSAGLIVAVWTATAPHPSLDLSVRARLPGGRLLDLRGTGVPDASARLYIVDGGRRAELVVNDLPPLPDGRVYQLWFVVDEQSVQTAGSLYVNRHGDALARLAVPVPLERISAVAVTEEPIPFSPAPTGTHLLAWTP